MVSASKAFARPHESRGPDRNPEVPLVSFLIGGLRFI